MSIEYIWQLPTAGDARYGRPGPIHRGEGGAESGKSTFNYFDYLHQVARAADIGGFDGLLVQHDEEGDESWIVAGYLARGTRHLRLIAGFDASWGSPVYAAKNAVSFQRASGARFAWHLADAQGNPRTDEFLSVARGVQTQAPFDFKGEFYEVRGGGFKGTLAGNPLPPVYLEGGSDASLALSARHADVHILPSSAIPRLKSTVDRLHSLAAAQGRSVGAGLRLVLVARETEHEARLAAQQQQAGPDALVGSYAQVQAQLREYADAGISTFILSAGPALEEAWRVAEYLLPQLREAA